MLFAFTSCSKNPVKDNNQTEENNNNNNNSNNGNDNNKNEVIDKIEEQALNKLKEMTIEEKVGQLFLVRCPLKDQLDLFMSMNPGGFILFGRDFTDKTEENVIDDIKLYQSKSNIPMVIGVDEEGGTVVRASSNRNLSEYTFKSPQELYKLGGFEEIYSDTIKKSNFLLNLGINLNLAPVADVSVNEADFINERSFGANALQTSKYVKTVVKAMNEAGISSTLKHFPGYGNNVDTHTGSAVDKRTYEDFVTNDFLPFESGIKSGTQTILVSHNIVESMDKEYAASLSKKVINILRHDLEFKGVIMTDDLSMGAVQQLKNVHEPEVTAVLAGEDMLIVTDFEKSYNTLLNAVKSKVISIERIDESVLRILKWKYATKIIN
jgi:beta-N-acetylhexosaminidase